MIGELVVVQDWNLLLLLQLLLLFGRRHTMSCPVSCEVSNNEHMDAYTGQ